MSTSFWGATISAVRWAASSPVTAELDRWKVSVGDDLLEREVGLRLESAAVYCPHQPPTPPTPRPTPPSSYHFCPFSVPAPVRSRRRQPLLSKDRKGRLQLAVTTAAAALVAAAAAAAAVSDLSVAY